MFTGQIEIEDKVFNFFKDVTNSKADISYDFTDVYFLAKNALFTPRMIETSKKAHLLETAKLYAAKYETIAKKETTEVYNTGCQIIFISKRIPPAINGETKLNQSIVLCFPKVNTQGIMKAFETLFKAKYVEAITKEKDPFKIQKLGVLFNSEVIFYTPFFLYENPLKSKLPFSFANLNSQGISLNKLDVNIIYNSFRHLILNQSIFLLLINN